MFVILQIFVFQVVISSTVLCTVTQHNSQVNQEILENQNNIDKVSEELPSDITLSTDSSQNEFCTKDEDSPCEISNRDWLAEEDAKEKYSDNTESYGKKPKTSGWFSDWDLIFSSSEEKVHESENDDRDNSKKESSVKVLHQKGDFERFLRIGHVVIVFFYKDVQSETQQRFLDEYDISSDHLLQYGIYLAVADCDVYGVRNYCSAEKVNRFAYGFREGQEKIAFPLDTLFNNNAIVASALHLDLINAVPILQTAGERREVERRCKGRCDIIFSFQRTLGTYEHRMFLEIAHAYQDSYVFAITTYTAGTLGLSDSFPQDEEDVEHRLWVVHCADKSPQQQCVVSHFRRKMLLPDLLQFIAALQLPKWHDLDVSPTKNVVITPYDETSLPWVILIYDDSCKPRVMALAPDLAQLLHGTVATITLDLDKINEEALHSLHLKRSNIVTPALAFLHHEQEKIALINDYDEPLEWVNEQLAAIFDKPESKEELGYQPVQALEELLQDDEVVMDMQREDTISNISPLSGPEPYRNAIKANSLTLIAFYLAWDPVSSMLLQHMNEIVPYLSHLGSQAALHRINCFDWPKLCEGLGITGYPELRIYPKNKPNVTYNGPIHSESLLKTILLYGKPIPLELSSLEDMERLLTLDPDIHQACYLLQSVAVGVFPSPKDCSAFLSAAQSLKSSHLTGLYISKQTTEDVCGNDRGCILISKPKDHLQPRVIMDTSLDNSSKIITFLQFSSDLVLAPLSFERLSTLSSVSDGDGSSSLNDQYLIMLFIPSGSLLPQSHKEAKHASMEEAANDKMSNENESPSTAEIELWSVIGQLAVEFSEPGFVFSWIKRDDPLAQKLSSAYQLSGDSFHLVAVNWRHSSGYKDEETKGEAKDRSGIHTYTCPDLSSKSLRPWIISLREGLLKPSVMLGDHDWEPRLPGFDYIKFMMEDDDRDAEDQLMMEMENDLSSHSQQGEHGDSLLHIHEEF